MEYLPALETDRLILTAPQAADIPIIVAYAGNKNIADNTLNIPHPYAEKEAVYWLFLSNQGLINSTNYIFAIRLKTAHALIGDIGLTIT